MPKNLLQDMVRNKRSDSPKGGALNLKNPTIQKREIKVIARQPIYKKSRYKIWLVAIISVVFLFFALSFMFSSATVTVTPRSQSLVLNENLSAHKDGTSSLPFDLVVIVGEEDKDISTTQQKDVAVKATGTVVMYNAFSTSPQLLSIDTRLQGSNGKMYKTLTKTTVPGKSKTGTPGSVEVKIYADVAGTESNSTPLDFNILGFKGTAKYTGFYARSKGDITGGFKGVAPYLSDADQAIAVNSLKDALKTKLLQKATDQIPPGFILFKNGAFLSTDDNSVDLVGSLGNTVALKLHGTLYGILLDENKITKKIAQDTIDKYDGSDVYIPNIRNLNFSLSPQSGVSNTIGTSLADIENINFNISGATKIVWKVDSDKLVQNLLGKAKKDFNQVLLQFPSINAADLTLSPFWRMSIPDKIKNVKVIVNYPK